jgi:hypothetical protein
MSCIIRLKSKPRLEVKERPQPDETYHAEAVERRFEAALRSALKASPKPLKDGLAKPAESKRKREAPLKVLAHRERQDCLRRFQAQ